MTEAKIAAIDDETSDLLTPRERAAVTFAEKLAVDHHKVDDALWAELRAHLTDAEIIELTAHAATVIAERGIELAWVERVLRAPERVHADRTDPALTHALGRVEERGQRVLRVVYNASASPPRVVTAYFDRRQRGEP